MKKAKRYCPSRSSSRLRAFAVPFFIAPLALCTATFANTATAPHGMVASVQPLATDAGVNIMTAGGNAIDAAVATALTLGVVDGHDSGIGGGCFMLIHTADGKTVALDGREMAPAAATPTMFIKGGKGDTDLSQNGALASGVPGSLAVYDYAMKHFGKKQLHDALEPAADIAENGFAIDRVYAAKLTKLKTLLEKYAAIKAIMIKPDGSLPVEGDILKQPDLAKTYRRIAHEGIPYFYNEDFPRLVEAWMEQNGGILTAADFANYRMKIREPLQTRYRGYTILGMPPPSSGGIHVAEILNILQNFDLAALQKKDPVLRIHVEAEAMKLAFADRAFWLGDPDFVHVPRGLIDADYGKQLAKEISLDHTKDDVQHGSPPNFEDDYFGKHTTHIAAADDQGNWVAITTTVNTAFGSKIVIPGTGVIMNDQMDDFSIQPGVANAFHLVGGEANAPGPGKRPLSSMSPTIILKDGKPFMTVGAAGGPRIITQVLQAIVNVIDLGDDLPAALERPRIHQQWSPPELWIENTFPAEQTAALQKLGWKLDPQRPTGACNAIMQMPDGTLTGVSEPRLPGKAGGE